MIDTLLEILPLWGAWLVGLTTFLSCLMLPVPSSLLMLAAGAFTATGDLSMIEVGTAALIGAVMGDVLGFTLAERIATQIGVGPKSGPLLAKATDFLNRRGFMAIFLTRWLFSPLGPWTNLAAGLTRFKLARFVPASIAGEAVWVAIYLGLGRIFGANYAAAADLAGSALGLLAGIGAALFLGRYLWQRRHQTD
ncbi:MAG: DedA family protein [Paracoccus sp. (in: a-proteobacteria)]